MITLRRPITRFASLLATVGGFAGVMMTMIGFGLAGVPLHFNEGWQLLFTLYLSILAIVQSSAILVGQSQGERAIQAKLDELLRAIDKADDRLIGIENQVEEV